MARHRAESLSEISETTNVHHAEARPTSCDIHKDSFVSHWTSLLSDDFASPSMPARGFASQYETRDHIPLSYAKKPRASRFVSGTQSKDISLKLDSAQITEEAPSQHEVRQSRRSRFIPASYTKDNSFRYENVEELPPPIDDEKVLASIVSARLELATLKKNHAKDGLTIQRLEDRIAQDDRRDNPKRRRGDSAIGSNDGDSEREVEVGNSERKLLVEKNRLETAVRQLQGEVHRLNQAATKAETNIKQFAKDRDSALAQLLEAQFTVEQLKTDNNSLEEINSMLKNSLDAILEVQNTTLLLPDEPQQRLNHDQVSAKQQYELDIQNIEQQKFAQQQLEQRELELQRRKLARQNCDQIELNRQKELDRWDLEQKKLHQQNSEKQRLDLQKLDRQKRERLQTPASQLEAERKSTTTETDPKSQMSEDGITYVSIPSTREIGDLRETLEQERRERHPRQGAPAPDVATEKGFSRPGPSGPVTSIEDDLSSCWAGEVHPESVDEPLPTFNPHVKDGKKPFPTSANSGPKTIRKFEDKPIPIPCDDEPTIRPSQPLAVALASVIKGLEDELANSKRELAQNQNLYNNQNPALAKRARKSLKQKIDNLLQKIDGKADHIYSLYDVVEAQKQKGKEFQDSEAGEEKVRETLRGLGLENLWA